MVKPMSPTPPLFVFGTLRDADVFFEVTGLALSDVAPRPAEARGEMAVRVPGASYPMLVARPGMSAPGLVLEALPEAALAALDRYEGPSYARFPTTVVSGASLIPAQVYRIAGVVRPAVIEPWSLDDWQRLHKARFLKRLREGRDAPDADQTP